MRVAVVDHAPVTVAGPPAAVGALWRHGGPFGQCGSHESAAGSGRGRRMGQSRMRRAAAVARPQPVARLAALVAAPREPRGHADRRRDGRVPAAAAPAAAQSVVLLVVFVAGQPARHAGHRAAGQRAGAARSVARVAY